MTVCRKYTRRADNQFEILDAFQEAGWPPFIRDPLGDIEKMTQTIKDFNKAVEPDTPFRLRPDNLRVAWKVDGTTHLH